MEHRKGVARIRKGKKSTRKTVEFWGIIFTVGRRKTRVKVMLMKSGEWQNYILEYHAVA